MSSCENKTSIYGFNCPYLSCKHEKSKKNIDLHWNCINRYNIEYEIKTLNVNNHTFMPPASCVDISMQLFPRIKSHFNAEFT